MHMALVWNRTFTDAGDRSRIPATFQVLNQRDRDIFSVTVVFARDPEAFRLSPRDQDRAMCHVLRHIPVGLTDELGSELDAAGRVLTTLEHHDRHTRACKGEGRHVGTHRPSPTR
jgi:hypothetical protein